MADATIVELFYQGLISLVSVFVGALLGASLAFRNERSAKETDRRNHNIAGARRALYAVGRQINTLNLYKQRVLDPSRNHPGRYLDTEPVGAGADADVWVNAGDLEFLLDPKTGDPELAFKVDLANSAFHSAVATINDFVRFSLDEFQPAWNRAGLPVGVVMIEPKVVEEALGDLVTGRAKTYTTSMYEHVDSALEKLVQVNGPLLDASKSRFKGNEFAMFVPMTQPPDEPSE